MPSSQTDSRAITRPPLITTKLIAAVTAAVSSSTAAINTAASGRPWRS